MSVIGIIFQEDLLVNSQITFKQTNLDLTEKNFTFNWQSVRFRANQVAVAIPTAIAGESTAINFVNAFNLDYNSTNLYEVTRTGSYVEIRLLNVVFDNETATLNGVNIKDTSVIFAINLESIIPININTATFSTASTPCSKITVNVESDEIIGQINSPILVNGNGTNQLSFETTRGGQITLEVQGDNLETDSRTIQLPDLLSSANFEVLINTSPNGATVTMKDNNYFNSSLEYSLDNVNWQNDNYFSSIASGDYQFYVRDNYGCSFSIPFAIDEYNISEPFYRVSKENSIGFYLESELSCNDNVKLPYKTTQLYTLSDTITTQLKTNYTTITAKIGNDSYLAEKKTSNIGLNDKIDAFRYNYNDTQTGIYFTAGNRYNYTTDAVESQYALNGGLPEWGVIGQFIEIGLAWFEIVSIFYETSKNAYVCVIDAVYSGNEDVIQVGTVYNRENYEVYEFAIPMTGYNEQTFSIDLTLEHDNFETVNLVSEEVYVSESHEETLYIESFNDENTDIMYSTNIVHKLRVPFELFDAEFEDETENHKTDSSTILLKSDISYLKKFVFEPFALNFAKRLVILLSNSNVSIDGSDYVKNSIEVEKFGANTNLYKITATMNEADNDSTSSDNSVLSGGTEGVVETGTGYEVPSIIGDADNLLGY